MAWTSLATRLSSAPLILAGPVLRRVTTTSVTVWVAVQTQVNVTLTVYDADSAPLQTKLGTATRPAAMIGKNLFIVAVTAPTTTLWEGKVYFYDLHFTSTGPPLSLSLVQAITKPGGTPDQTRIAYLTYALPSFVLPPKDLNKVRLIQGSCRKPNGGEKDQPDFPETPDALAMLDGLIAASASDAYGRPQQLLLTGDQIYADEVADVLLAALMDASHTLMGWDEQLPSDVNASGNPFGPYDAATQYPTTRDTPITNARFTTEDRRSHLMALGEYIAMYLFAWSDELFIPTPTIDEFATLYPSVVLDDGLKASMITQRNAVEQYRKDVPKVRRALANIPSYMICDDHEITDDWNMTRTFCDNVYGNKLGMRIIQNGLVAYSVCQAWGNFPEQFWDGTQAAGTQMLAAIAKFTPIEAAGTHIYDTFAAQLQAMVGLHAPSALAARSPYGVYHDLDPMITVQGVQVSSQSLRFHYTVEATSHQVIVTDSRTWRQFPIPGGETHPDLIGLADLQRQLITDAPDLGDRVLLIVVTTNAPPTVGIREAAFIAGAANYYVGKRAGVYYYKSKKFLYKNDVNDSWEFPAAGTDRLFKVISDKLPLVSGDRTGQAILLSGDVHFSFASRLAFWAEVQRLGDPANQPQTAKVVYAQLVASSLKNEKHDTRGMQRDGYSYTPADWQQHATWPFGAAGYVGWNTDLGTKTKVARLPPGIIAPGVNYDATLTQPTLIVPLIVGNSVELNAKADYRYRLDYLTTVATGQTVPSAPVIVPPNVGNPLGSTQSFATAAGALMDLIDSSAKLPDAIGYNNISEVSFVWTHPDGTPATSVSDPQVTTKVVRHLLRWQSAVGDQLWARYDVSLVITDSAYLPLKANSEP